MKFIDVHCHINAEDYGDLDKLIRNINAAGVEKIISAGFDLVSSEYGKYLSERYEGVYFTAGFHPTELKKYRAGDLDKIAELAAHPKCVAVGEIGLDYHYPDTDKQLQHGIFKEQLGLARSLKMPVQIHSRDCAEDMYGVLREFAPFEYGAMLHCYSHSAELAAEFLKLGLKFSFGGSCTWKGSKRVKRAIAALPREVIMTETDSPYIPPASKYGEFPNTPESVPEIAGQIALIKGWTTEEAAESCWNAAHSLFTKLNDI